MSGPACSAVPSPLKPQESSCGPRPTAKPTLAYWRAAALRPNSHEGARRLFGHRTSIHAHGTPPRPLQRSADGAGRRASRMPRSRSRVAAAGLELHPKQLPPRSAIKKTVLPPVAIPVPPSTPCPARPAWTRSRQSTCPSPYAATRARKHRATRAGWRVAGEGQVQG